MCYRLCSGLSFHGVTVQPSRLVACGTILCCCSGGSCAKWGSMVVDHCSSCTASLYTRTDGSVSGRYVDVSAVLT